MAARLEVVRFRSGTEATISRIYLVTNDGAGGVTRELLCHGLENAPIVAKGGGKPRIPAGSYPLTLRTVGGFHSDYAKRFSWHIGMIWVRNVPGRSFILHHIGNKDKDTRGCTLYGQWRGADNWVGQSGATYARVYQRIAPMIARGELSRVIYVDADQ